MYIRRLLFPLLVFLLILLPKIAMAQAVAPSTTNCTAACQRWLTWPGTTYGVFSSFTVSNPTLTSSGTVYIRYIVLSPTSNYTDEPQVQLGIVKNPNPTSEICGPGLHYFEDADVGGANIDIKCASVPSGAINNDSHFQENFYTSNGGGDLVQITDSFGTHLNDFIPYTDGVHKSYGSINLIEHVEDNISGHYVWGSEWDSNEWVTGDGVFHLVTVDGSFTGGVPPQMYWQTPPSQSAGGLLYSCDYDSTQNQCQFGSLPSGARVGR